MSWLSSPPPVAAVNPTQAVLPGPRRQARCSGQLGRRPGNKSAPSKITSMRAAVPQNPRLRTAWGLRPTGRIAGRQGRRRICNRHRMHIPVRHVDGVRQLSKIVNRDTATLVYAVRASQPAVLNRNIVVARVNAESVVVGIELYRQTVRDATGRRRAATGAVTESDPAAVRAQCVRPRIAESRTRNRLQGCLLYCLRSIET